jgi:acyl-coenzyme A synthetase/AMP-(fatty) acid ligase
MTRLGAGLCVGRPFDGVDIRILRITEAPIASMDDAVRLGPGEVGEVVVRSKHVSPAYVADAPNTRWHKIPSDTPGAVWHRVGDAGYLDDEGRLWYCGRVSQRVETDAGVLFPLQVEPVFNEHAAVRRSALVGVREGDSMRPAMCVELEPNSDRDQVRRALLALAARTPATSKIRTILFRRRLPVDPRHNSKIDRPALARWAAGQLARSPRRADRDAAIAAEAR